MLYFGLIESVSGDLIKCIFRILLQIILDNNFLTTSKLQQVKLRRFLDIFWQSWFGLPPPLPSPRKVKSKRFFKLRDLIKTRTDLVQITFLLLLS